MTTTEQPPEDQVDPRPPAPRPQPETLVYRALRLRCPRCGQGRLFAGWFRMNHRCSHCKLLFDRQGGYYLGSTYINYGITAWIVTVTFVICRFFLGIRGEVLLWPLAAFCILFPLLIFRYARALWFALDCQFDRSVLNETEDDEPGNGE